MRRFLEQKSTLVLQAYMKLKFSSTLESKNFFTQFYLVLTKTLMNYKLLCLGAVTAKEFYNYKKLIKNGTTTL